MVLHLCEKLQLEQVELFHMRAGNKYVVEKNEIMIGEGDGCTNYYVEFYFDDDENIIGHGVWE